MKLIFPDPHVISLKVCKNDMHLIDYNIIDLEMFVYHDYVLFGYVASV